MMLNNRFGKSIIRQHWPLAVSLLILLALLVLLNRFSSRDVSDRDLQQPFPYWEVISQPVSLPGLSLNIVLVGVIILVLAFGRYAWWHYRPSRQFLWVWLVMLFWFVAPLTILYRQATESPSALYHLQSVALNQQVYHLARLESYPSLVTHTGIYIILECDASGNICSQKTTSASFPLGEDPVASLHISLDGTTLYVGEAG